MKTVNLATSFVLAGAIAFAGAASANDYPYGFFTASKDDNSVRTVDSFNPVKVVKKNSSDDDTAVDSFNSEKTITKTKTDDHSATDSFNNDLKVTKQKFDDHSIADSYNKDLTIKTSDDHSIADSFNSDDDTQIDTRYTYDYTSKYNVAKPELNSIKYQSQDAGHKGSSYAHGSADGHEVSTTGSTNYLEVGNETSSAFMSPTFVNNNVPVNTVVAGDNLGNILTSTKVAGRDQDVNRGIMNSDIGNTTSFASGDVSQTSLSAIEQSGDSAASIADPMNVSLSQ